MNTPDPTAIIWRWTPPESVKIGSTHDCADEYAVEERETAVGGIILHAQYHGEWDLNPWNPRYVIAELLRQLKAKQ